MVALDYGERRSVFYNDGVPADECLAADAAELVHAGVCSDIGAVGDLDVAGKCRGVGHYHFFSDPAVVGDVSLGHQQVVVADLC